MLGLRCNRDRVETQFQLLIDLGYPYGSSSFSFEPGCLQSLIGRLSSGSQVVTSADSEKLPPKRYITLQLCLFTR